MKKFLLIIALLSYATAIPAQDVTQAVAPSTESATAYTPEQLDQLTAPIALYPDALVALILPAATAPSDIVIAAQYLSANGDPAQISNQPWDDSVKALCNYPDVIQWMANNLDWTSALGRAFIQQPTQVMESIQQLRSTALANGTLTQTPEQQVYLAGNSILIEPATPDAICVPQYNPDILFDDYPVVYTTPVIFFGPPCRVGPWLRYECDWDDYGIWLGVWHSDWRYYRDWRTPAGSPRNGAYWRPDPVHQRELLRTVNRPVAAPPRPRLMPNTPQVTVRPNQGARPAGANPSARPDPTGWHADGDGHLAVPPRPAGQSVQTGPRIITSGEATSPPSRPSPQGRAPDLNAIRSETPKSPQAETPTSPRPETPTAPFVSTPTSPAVQSNAPDLNTVRPVTPNPARSTRPQGMVSTPQPVTSAPRPAPVPITHTASAPSSPPPIVRPAAPVSPGPAFGGFDRGTTVQDFSNRGQASRAEASPPPTPRPAPAPAPVERQSSPAPSSGGSNNNNPRLH
ncbi:MAG TPA: DUF3300 domain-containing protein [Opitutales bacterium]|nr:DUF3300 domain-containing protein [Opitutales bacterium]